MLTRKVREERVFQAEETACARPYGKREYGKWSELKEGLYVWDVGKEKGEADGAGGIDGDQMMFVLVRILIFNLKKWRATEIS